MTMSPEDFRLKTVDALARIEERQKLQGSQLTAVNTSVSEMRTDHEQRISKMEGARGAVRTMIVSGIAFFGAVVGATITTVVALFTRGD